MLYICSWKQMPAEMSFIADNTGRAKVTLWEQNIDALTPDSSYSLQNFVVREYKGRKYLSMPREGAEIIPIPDVGPIDTERLRFQAGTPETVQRTNHRSAKARLAYLGCRARVEPSNRCTDVAKLQICFLASSKPKSVHCNSAMLCAFPPTWPPPT